MKVNEIVQEMGLEVLCDAGDLSREVTGCYIGDLLSWVMTRAGEGQIWITIMTNINVVAVAVLCEVSAVLIPENCPVEETTLTRAQEQGVTILRAKGSAYACAAALSRLI